MQVSYLHTPDQPLNSQTAIQTPRVKTLQTLLSHDLHVYLYFLNHPKNMKSKLRAQYNMSQ